MGEFLQTGGCQCGAVRYSLSERPKVIYCCHCTECQKQASSAFGISVRVRASTLSVTGETKSYERPSASGSVLCDFCPTCGSRLFHKRSTYADTLNIKGGTFDDASWIKPAGHIWVASKHPWLALPPDDLTYDHQPGNYDALSAIYQKDT